MSARYAVYFCPQDGSPLARFGERVLGRTAEGLPVPASADDYPERAVARKLAAVPAHYGFHATLKAPFRLTSGSTQTQLLAAVESLASAQQTVDMLSMVPANLSGFLALTFKEQPSAVEAIANSCVLSLEPFRAPLTNAEIAKRKPQQLSDRQVRYLHDYGYPFVMHEFKFHMTLTGKLSPDESSDYLKWLRALYEHYVPTPPRLDRLSVFWQPDLSTPFTRLAEFPFG